MKRFIALRNKLILYITIGSLISFTSTIFILGKHIAKYQREQALTEIQNKSIRVKKSLLEYTERYSMFAKEYVHWDYGYNKLAVGSKPKLKKIVNEEMGLLLLLNGNNILVDSYVPKSEWSEEINELKNPIIKDINDCLPNIDKKVYHSGFFNIAGVPAFLISAPVTHSTNKSYVGRVIFIKYMTNSYIKKISKLSSAELKLLTHEEFVDDSTLTGNVLVFNSMFYQIFDEEIVSFIPFKYSTYSHEFNIKAKFIHNKFGLTDVIPRNIIYLLGSMFVVYLIVTVFLMLYYSRLEINIMRKLKHHLSQPITVLRAGMPGLRKFFKLNNKEAFDIRATKMEENVERLADSIHNFNKLDDFDDL